MFSFFNFAKLKEFILRYVQPSLYIRGLENFTKYWKVADVKDRGILLLVFAPMFICLAGLGFSIVYFVLFVLPSYFFSFIGWALLTAIFGEGANYFYNHLTGSKVVENNDPEYIDVQYTENKK
ncbi:MAG: hypothetical protein IJM82_05780 [Synergistaceae bacterium]|nr:hypothetical protein [Synergistaceae bacterium]MBR0316659.1 hypothetical protein [Synergistaceae bacterium]